MRKDCANCVIRRAGHGDLGALLALEEACFATDRLSRRQYRRHLDSTSACVLVADDGSLLGCAVVFFRRSARVARLYSLATAPQARGSGVASALLMHVEAVARARGCNRLRLEVRMDNRAATTLYEHAGFRCFGRYQHYYEDGADAWRYERQLDGPEVP